MILARTRRYTVRERLDIPLDLGTIRVSLMNCVDGGTRRMAIDKRNASSEFKNSSTSETPGIQHGIPVIKPN